MREETGLDIQDLEFLTATNSVMANEGKHYVTIFMGGYLSDQSAQPQVSLRYTIPVSVGYS